MDKDQIRGIVIITLLLFVYIFFFSSPASDAVSDGDSVRTDSLKKVQLDSLEKIKKENALENLPDSVIQARFGTFAEALKPKAVKEISLENDMLQIGLSSHRPYPTSVTLKNFQSYGGGVLNLIDPTSNTMSAQMPLPNGQIIDLYALNYEVVQNDPASVEFILKPDSANAALQISHKYTLKPGSYQVEYQLQLLGFEGQANQEIRLVWAQDIKRVEKDLSQTRIRTNINFFDKNGTFDYVPLGTSGLSSYTPETDLAWISMKQKFFNTGLFTENKFSKTQLSVYTDTNKEDIIKKTTAEMSLPMASSQALKFYFGPNDYDLCNEFAASYHKNVDLGWSVFSTINLYVIIPLFNFLESMFGSFYGLTILILVIIIKTVLFPLTYKSYVSMAKMKMLKPEIDQINKQYTDMQQRQMASMDLYRKMGVNPLSGCIPMLVQLPVLLAMFNFFPNALALRQKSFLWADDLSTYDSILDFGFNIPFYGDHISLFTILMAVSTIVYTYINNQVTTVSGPMKYIGYFMPLMFMFFLNDYAAGLTYYYFVSNLVTIAQQLIIKRFVTDENLLKKMEENRLKREKMAAATAGGSGGGFRKRLEEANKKLIEARKAKQDKKK